MIFSALLAYRQWSGCGWSGGRRTKHRRWQKHPLVHDMTALPLEFAVFRRWTSRHSRWWISAVRKLRSSHGCGGLVLRVFFLFFCGSVKVLSSFPVFFLAMNYHWTKLFFLIWVSEEKSEWGHFFGEKSEWKAAWLFIGHRKQRQKQSSAKSWPKPDRSREKACYMTKSTKSPLHANRDSGVDRWRGQRDTKHGTVGFWS